MLAVGRIARGARGDGQEATSRIEARNHFSLKSLNKIMITCFHTSLALTGLRAFIGLAARTKASVVFAPECPTNLALRVAVVALVTSTYFLLGIAVGQLRASASDDDLSRTTVSAPDGFVWPCGVQDEVSYGPLPPSCCCPTSSPYPGEPVS